MMALRKSTGPLTAVYKYRIQILLSLSFGAVFLSLLSEHLLSYRVPPATLWIVSSIELSVYSTLFLLWWISASLEIKQSDPQIFNWFAFSRMIAGHFVVVVLQLAFLFAILDVSGPAAYLTGLIWYLLHATQQFARMLYVRAKSDLRR